MNESHGFDNVPRQKIVVLARTGLFLAVLMAIQLVGLPNLLTGILVNAILIFVLLMSGLRHALFLGMLSPIGGIISGHLPAPLYPVLPVIICGNFVFVGACLFMTRLGAALPVRCLLPAFLKAMIIGFAGFLVVKMFDVNHQANWLLLPVLGIQFFTAFGGLLAGERFFQALLRARGKAS